MKICAILWHLKKSKENKLQLTDAGLVISQRSGEHSILNSKIENTEHRDPMQQEL